MFDTSELLERPDRMEEMLGRLLKQPLDKERHWRSPLSSLLVRVLFIARSGE